ncbi:MAG: alpha/beta hydrolase [Betaproteobacteria bacterium HGW-Betaproteobacteria-7]|jgi:pimeloyl-ACP methyl ester carboxylesterase|nr:MAG: alpha/beta hydrolase [Betaproteobacteria bacterium HGW-Betaproteobacteria-7]
MSATVILPNGIQLAYESFGDEEAPVILLIMGLGSQLVRWNIELCEELVAMGYRVIRFDNRDCGRSSHLDGAFVPAIGGGTPLAVPYALEDMAADAVGLLNALGIVAAHVAGASLGGAVAQLVAAGNPERTLSLTSIMSSSGNPALPPPTPTAAQALFAPLPRELTRDNVVADAIQRFRTISSPAYPTDEERLRWMFGLEYDRGFNPRGVVRQLGALIANGDRRPLLRTIAVPTVVVHGREDPLIRVACGEDVARSIPRARLEVIDGMGHDLPLALTHRIAEAIAAAGQA